MLGCVELGKADNARIHKVIFLQYLNIIIEFLKQRKVLVF